MFRRVNKHLSVIAPDNIRLGTKVYVRHFDGAKELKHDCIGEGLVFNCNMSGKFVVVESETVIQNFDPVTTGKWIREVFCLIPCCLLVMLSARFC